MPFNKLFVMAPMLLAVRKLDSESLDTILYVRCAYAFAQVIVVTCVLYCIIKAKALAAGKYGSTAIYVPPPAQVRSLQGIEVKITSIDIILKNTEIDIVRPLEIYCIFSKRIVTFLITLAFQITTYEK